MPQADPFSKKRGFTVPVGDWIAAHAAEIAPLMAKSIGISEICRSTEVERLFRSLREGDATRKGRACWNLLFYALWHRIHIEGVAPEGNTAALLAVKT